ncbi:MAG TPA: helix-turn-helix domain-containing protein, partial [Pyrinomonadaceae bacterium]
MGLITTAQAAERLGISVRRVQELINSQRLPAQQFGRTYVVNEEDLKLVENRKVGRPPKAKDETGKLGKK